MGYQGFVRFYESGPATDPLVILATGASVNIVLEPIYSSSVWGAGWYNAAMTAHYADNAIRFEGSVDFELQGSNAIWDLLADWIINERAYPRSLDISPDGARVYEYHTTGAYDANYDLNGAWNTSASISTSQGSFVTVGAGVIALNRSEEDPAGGTSFSDYSYILQKEGVVADDCAELGATNPLNPSGNNVDPIPYWRTNAQLLRGTFPTSSAGTPSALFAGGAVPQAGLETVEWSVDQTQNHVVLYTCNGTRLPTALLQGPIDVTGNVILYHPDGVFDPILGPDHSGNLTQPYLYAENTWFRVEIPKGANSVFIQLNAVVVESDEYSIPGQSDVTNRTFTMKGLGGRCIDTNTTLPPMVMSVSDGSWVGP
jgi:hypothetical protein